MSGNLLKEDTQLNVLGDELINIIKSNKEFFKPLKIVVPNLKLEQWFKAYWLRKESGVLCNVNFDTIDHALLSLLDTDKKVVKIIKKEALTVLIIKNLINHPEIFNAKEQDNKKEQEEKAIINIYIKDKNGIKLYDLASQLANLFIIYDNNLVWNKTNSQGWCRALYEAVMQEAYPRLSEDSTLKIERKATLKYICDDLAQKDKKNNQSSEAQDSSLDKNTCAPKEHKDIFKNGRETLYFFGFTEFLPLYEKIINAYSHKNTNAIYKLMLKNKVDIEDKNILTQYSVMAAPSILREVEGVHSEICHLLQNKDLNFSDILVCAPNMSLYEPTIARVFKQDDKHYPNIPYTINDAKKIETDVSFVLRLLYHIAKKDFFTRVDFADIIHNLTVQKVRGISADQAVQWCQAIVNMNVYRLDDWKYAKKRLLLSKAVAMGDLDESTISIKGQDYLPYSAIGFDDDSIVKFIKVIDDIYSWIEVIKNNKNVIKDVENNKDTLADLLKECDKWFSIKNDGGYETNLYYKSVVNLLEDWKNSQLPNNIIPMDTLMYHMMDVSLAHEYGKGAYFTQGITFADLDNTTVISAPYIFVLGMNSEAWPRVNIKSELDMRSEKEFRADQIKDKMAFNLLMHNAEKYVFLSYVNKDLKTDEDFYPSVCLDDVERAYLKTFYNSYNFDVDNSRKEFEKAIYNKKIVSEIHIDESRSWNDLFTKREFSNKTYNKNLLKSVGLGSTSPKSTSGSELIKNLTIKDLADYLEDPLKLKATKLFGYDDNLDENMRDEFEPFILDKLKQSNLVKTLTPEIFKGTDTQTEIMNKANLTHVLPQITEDIKSENFKIVEDQCQAIIDLINKQVGTPSIIQLNDLVLNYGKDSWILTCNQAFCCIKDNDTNRTYIQMKKLAQYNNISELTVLYVISLMDIASLNDNNTYHIKIVRSEKCCSQYDLTSKDAIELLNNIYHDINDYEHNYFIHINKLDTRFDRITDLLALVKNNYDGSLWNFFDGRLLFEEDEQFGYTYENFVNEYIANLKHHLSLIRRLLGNKIKAIEEVWPEVIK